MIRRRREARAPTIGDASQSLIAGALLPLAAVLRFLWLGHASLSIDELFSVCWSQLDLHFLLGEGARTETNSPGYYVPLHVRMGVFGTTELAVRALSALTSTATVAVVYAIGRVIANRPTTSCKCGHDWLGWVKAQRREPIEIAASKKIAFRPAKELKEAV